MSGNQPQTANQNNRAKREMNGLLRRHERIAFLLKNSVNGLPNGLVSLLLSLLPDGWCAMGANGAMDGRHREEQEKNDGEIKRHISNPTYDSG